MDNPLALKLSPARSIAYHKHTAQGDGTKWPGVVFLGGFKSDMGGIKALFLEDWAKARGRAFVRFDYRGHGGSSGAFEDHGIGDWAEDAAAVLEHLTEGPQILVGSSMGGWIALLLAARMPHRVAGLVGIAAAPDFTEDGMWAAFSEAERRALRETGRIEVPSAYQEAPYVITRHLIEDGRRNLMLRSPLRLGCPVRLLHGTADRDVPMERGLLLLDHLEAEDARLTLVKGGGHRLSEPGELTLLGETVDEITHTILSNGAR